MNIFYLDNDPKTCAVMHNDKHVVKMILEYAQLMSTAHRVIDGHVEIFEKYVQGSLPARWRKTKVWKLDDDRDDILYKATHINHPSAVWTRQSSSNYEWLYDMWCHLLNEYTFRYEKQHACEKLIVPLSMVPRNIPGDEFTQPTPAMPEEYKVEDSLVSYQNYYVGSKHEMSRWTKRPMPNWFVSGINTKYGHSCYMFSNKNGDTISTSTINI